MPPDHSHAPPDTAPSWLALRDRSELRHRLEPHLASDPSETPLDDDIFDLVTFLFRASDPVLYPMAAVILGRHLPHSGRVAGWLEAYREARGIRPAERVELPGTRTHRRILIAAAAARTTGAAPQPTDPLAPLPRDVPLDRPADLAAYLRAARLLAELPAPPERLAAHLRALPGEVAYRPEAVREPGTAARWAEFVLTLEETLPPDAAATLARLRAETARALAEQAASPERAGVGRRVRLLRASTLASGEPTPGPRTDQALAAALALLRDPARWWALPEIERARTAGTLLELTINEGGAPAEPGRLLDAFEVPGSGRPAARLLLHLAAVEGEEPSAFIDAALLHTLADDRLLLRLVPRTSPGELGAALADAFEHRIRMVLATEPGFRLDEFLARIELRHPHAGFWRNLSAVVGDREYRRPDGTLVPLAHILETLEAEGPLGELRAGVRATLERLADEPHPRALARGFSDLLVGAEGSPGGLIELLERLHSSGEGVPVPDLHPMARALRELAGRVIPRELGGGEGARSATQHLRTEIDLLADRTAGLLPPREQGLLQRAASGADTVARRWSAALGALSEVRLEGADPGVAVVDRALDRADELDPATRAVWLETVAAHWSHLVERGIEDGLETRVARLLRDPGRTRLSRLPEIDGVLERARLWLFDCYRLVDAANVTRTLRMRRGEGGLRTLPHDMAAFFLHYSAVWLALLVGAILMLDFGDAWTAMAEAGDRQGVGITFGLGVLGAFGYVTAELHARVRDAPGDRVWANRGARILRALAFVGVCLAWSVAVVGLLWWLLSGTGEVVEGPGAVLHIIVWSGFSLFVGIFFGLIAKAA